MMNKFDSLYKIIMEDLSSKRKPIPKVDQMTPKQFIAFLKEFLPYVKNGKVDLDDIQITEKIDGNAIRLMTINGEMFFESSYSGITTWDKVPFKSAAQYLYNNYSQLFHDIYELIGCDFKLIGELIWIDDLAENEKITPVCASYLTEKFGTFGGIIIFDIFKINNDTLISVEEKEEIINMIYDLNDDDFSFYLMNNLNLNQNITFTLDTDKLLSLVNSPEWNKERFNTKTDAAILNEIKSVQTEVIKQLSDIIQNTTGLFSAAGDLIEGIVLKVKSSGNQYGIFSDGYKELKHSYFIHMENIENIYKEFCKLVFGKVQRSAIQTEINSGKNFEDNYNTYIKEYEEKIKNEFEKLKKLNIPKATKNSQLYMAEKYVNKLNSNLTSSQFISTFIFN